MLAQFEFEGEVIEWRGPAPFLFVAIPESYVGEVRYAAHETSYGWGVVPVSARIGKTDFTTSLFPRNGAYLLPVKLAVQRAERVRVGDKVRVYLAICRR